MEVNEKNDNEFITNSDVLIIAFHHAAFDGSTFPIFFNDLCNAYNINTVWSEDEESLQYIDYSTHERLMDMTPSQEFWHLQLEGFNLERRLPLPVDRHRSSGDQRSGLAFVSQISFDHETLTAFLSYASSHHVTLFQLELATFYAFLFKLTHGQTDLSISCVSANRYRSELQNMVGMFVSTLPYCTQIDPHWSFDELVKYVREKCLSILEHSHYPLQSILADLHLNQSKVAFLEIMFDFITISSNIDQLSFDGARFEQISLKQSSEAAKFDFKLTFIYNPALDDNKLSFRLACSRDLFDETTVTNISQRFKYLFEQLFSSNSIGSRIDTDLTPISKLDLILPEESKEIEDVVFCRQPNIVNEGMSIFSKTKFLMLDVRRLYQSKI
jgi:fengycin family lipopeptide synthetase D